MSPTEILAHATADAAAPLEAVAWLYLLRRRLEHDGDPRAGRVRFLAGQLEALEEQPGPCRGGPSYPDANCRSIWFRRTPRGWVCTGCGTLKDTTEETRDRLRQVRLLFPEWAAAVPPGAPAPAPGPANLSANPVPLL